jgi:hypothetical protein
MENTFARDRKASTINLHASLQAPLVSCVAIFAFITASFNVIARAQDTSAQYGPLRATNTARMRAETINGGLSQYRTASCMYAQGGGECLVFRSENGFTFRFFGGPPGWQQLGKPPTIETEIQISPDGRQVLQVVYNGPIR